MLYTFAGTIMYESGVTLEDQHVVIAAMCLRMCCFERIVRNGPVRLVAGVMRGNSERV